MSHQSCPSCSQPLAPARMGPVAIGVCVGCGGVALDQDRLAMLSEAGAEVLWKLWWKLQAWQRPIHRRSGGACPACAGRMKKEQIGGGEVDACASCSGVWLTTDSLAEVAAALSESELDRQWLESHPDAAPTSASGPVTGLPADRLACPDCGELNGDADPMCWACGGTLHDVCRTVACPSCAGAMRRVTASDVEMRACGFCGGVWTSAGDLRALLFLPPSEQQRIAEQTRRVVGNRVPAAAATPPCPCCRSRMQRAPLGSLLREEVATCLDCSGRFLNLTHLQDLVLGVQV